MATTKIDTRAAQAYEDHLVSTMFEPWARRVVDLGAPQRGEIVLDIACGTGIGARLAAPRVSPGGRIISVDIDPAMVAVAQKCAQDAGLPADVALDWQATPVEEFAVENASIDLCLCMQGPQFLTDPAAAMALIFQALKPGARLAASMWNEYPTAKGHYAIGQALLARGLKPALKPFSLGDPQVANALIKGAGFKIESFETEQEIIPFPSAKAFVGGVAAGAPATRHALAQLSPDDLDTFILEVEHLLSPYKAANGLALPTSAHVVLARRPR